MPFSAKNLSQYLEKLRKEFSFEIIVWFGANEVRQMDKKGEAMFSSCPADTSIGDLVKDKYKNKDNDKDNDKDKYI